MYYKFTNIIFNHIIQKVKRLFIFTLCSFIVIGFNQVNASNTNSASSKINKKVVFQKNKAKKTVTSTKLDLLTSEVNVAPISETLGKINTDKEISEDVERQVAVNTNNTEATDTVTETTTETTTDADTTEEESKPIIADPFETWNRAIFNFNTTADNYVVKPLAQGYQKIVPEPFRNCINGVFGTVDDIFTLANQALQLNGEGSSNSLCRLMINTTFGFGGCFDIASSLGCIKGNEDLGQTLGFWGVKTGPFIMLPFLGPSNVRDTLGFVATTTVNPTFTFDPAAVRNGIQVLNIVNTRANLLETTGLVDDVAIDPYSFIRDSFSQKRQNDVYNGEIPEEQQ